jgi:peptide/nickel transport system ATP-binding protein
MTEAFVTVRNLVTEINTPRGPIRPVRDVSLTVNRGETLAIVGESGSGKTMLVRSIMGLLPPNAAVMSSGSIVFDGNELVGAKPEVIRSLWGRQIALIPQDPVTSLNPVRKIGAQLTDGLELHARLSKRAATARATELLASVGIPDPASRLNLYPHEMSGGMRQRVLIALAVSLGPRLLIADEPTTALDVTVQKHILQLIDDLKTTEDMSVLLVSHDLSLVAEHANRVAVMYGGRLVETLPAARLTAEARHPYTRGLMSSHPDITMPAGAVLPTIPGEPPDVARPIGGCPFHTRCPARIAACDQIMPAMTRDPHDQWHQFACHNPVEATPSTESYVDA